MKSSTATYFKFGIDLSRLLDDSESSGISLNILIRANDLVNFLGVLETQLSEHLF
jgi:hypothetical protein